VALKIKRKPKERIELISLIDMIFILLVFFLVTSFVIRMPLQERNLYLPTPENRVGRAQIVIQFIDENRIFWLDEDAAAVAEEIEQNYGYLSPARLRDRVLTELIARNTISFRRLEEKLNQLRERANQDPFSRFFVLIRCPNELPYFEVVDVIGKISETTYQNIKYGCVGGTLDQIQSCRRIYTVVETDTNGQRRKNIRIDF
jgi:biopolymer transport protein ExbD